MKRNKILDEFPLDYDKTAEEQESDLLDYISSVLDQVEDAWKIAKDTADELY